MSAPPQLPAGGNDPLGEVREDATCIALVPAYNEAATVGHVVREIPKHAARFDVLVIDDGSTDATSEVARAAGVTVATLPFNLGVGGALRTGFRYAVDRGYDCVVQFDGDGQHDPGEISRLLPPLDAGADMVIGSRFAGGAATDEVGRVRSGAMRLLRVAVKLLSGQHISDTSSGFRAFSRPMLEYFSRNYPQEYLGDTVEALLLAAYAGHKVVEVPVAMRVRSGGVPSSRNVKLLYHYLRLLIVLISTTSVRGRRRMA